mmetsp:Transcript_5304/g.12526  ORF Transcript_5304/g.12526 Transcript_5304/m.12526 type:complete len:202 (+) Transcript_5304:210-815(+)
MGSSAWPSPSKGDPPPQRGMSGSSGSEPSRMSFGGRPQTLARPPPFCIHSSSPSMCSSSEKPGFHSPALTSMGSGSSSSSCRKASLSENASGSSLSTASRLSVAADSSALMPQSLSTSDDAAPSEVDEEEASLAVSCLSSTAVAAAAAASALVSTDAMKDDDADISFSSTALGWLLSAGGAGASAGGLVRPKPSPSSGMTV